MATPEHSRPARPLVQALLVALLIAIVAYFLWKITHVLLLAFAAVLFAVLLDGAASLSARHSPLSREWALAAVMLAGVVLAALLAWLFGAQIRSQFGQLAQQIPQSWETVKQQFGLDGLQSLLGSGRGIVSGALSSLGSALAAGLFAIGDLLLVVFGAVFLASRPEVYRRGFLLLFPENARDAARSTIRAIGAALRRWLLGQLISMAIIGALTTAALLALGVPSALALGLIAGLLEFVPIVGPILAAAPAVLVALGESGQLALLTLGAYLVIQQVESNLVLPLIERRMVRLPPALTLFAVVAIGIAFGALGVLLATPLTVAAYVAVRELYLRRALGENIEALPKRG